MPKYFSTALLFAFLFFTTAKNFAQSSKRFSAKSTAYIEGATQGPLITLNHDHIFREGKIFTKSYRIGFTVYKDVMAFPIGINFITGKNQHHAELSLTAIPYVENASKLFNSGNLSDKKLYIIPGAGYRYQKPTGGFFFKAIAAPVLLLDPPSDNFWKMEPKFFVGVSVAAGYSF